MSIPVNANTIKRHNAIVMAYYFEPLLLWGDADSDKGLRVEEVDSPVYRMEEDHRTEYRLNWVLPSEKQPWMAMLKVSCIEGWELAMHPRNYEMKVAAGG